MAADWTILGMEVQTLEDGSDEIDIVSPESALVVVRSLDKSGAVMYRVRATSGLTSVEAYGMAMYAADKLRASFGHNLGSRDER